MFTASMNSHFAPAASLANVKKIYHRLAVRYHPDKGGAHENFLAVGAAYERATRRFRHAGAARRNATPPRSRNDVREAMRRRRNEQRAAFVAALAEAFQYIRDSNDPRRTVFRIGSSWGRGARPYERVKVVRVPGHELRFVIGPGNSGSFVVRVYDRTSGMPEELAVEFAPLSHAPDTQFEVSRWPRDGLGSAWHALLSAAHELLGVRV